MSKHPRTEKLRRKLTREKASWETCAIKMIDLCREMEWELNYFNAVDAEYRDHLREVASDAKQDIRMLDWLLDNAAVQTGDDGNNYFVLPIIPATFCAAPLGKREAIIKEMEKQQTK